MAVFRPSWSSESTSSTPERPRSFSERNNSWYVASLSVSATSTPRISLKPSGARTAETIKTPWLTILWSTLTFS
jgi:hypothetical protein